jgi:hypothetical protein
MAKEAPITPEEAASPVPEEQRVDDSQRQEANEAHDREQLEKVREENRRARIAYLATIDATLPDKVEGWKQQFGRIESIHILGQLFIWRGMTRAEYIALMGGGQEKMKNEEAITSKCLLYPQIDQLDWVKMPAGLPTTLSDHVLATSGFGTEDPIPVRL